jgi:hypothetical protein
MAERARTKELTVSGIRKPKFLRIYVTYTIEPNSNNADDSIEKLLAKAELWWLKFKGEMLEVENQRIETIVSNAYNKVFVAGNKYYLIKWRWMLSPLTSHELWGEIWRRFNDTPPIDSAINDFR